MSSSKLSRDCLALDELREGSLRKGLRHWQLYISYTFSKGLMKQSASVLKISKRSWKGLLLSLL